LLARPAGGASLPTVTARPVVGTRYPPFGALLATRRRSGAGAHAAVEAKRTIAARMPTGYGSMSEFPEMG